MYPDTRLPREPPAWVQSFDLGESREKHTGTEVRERRTGIRRTLLGPPAGSVRRQPAQSLVQDC
jgi:hypothetical protein